MDIKKSFDKYQSGLQEIKDFFGIKSTIHEIYWCEEIRKIALPYGGKGYKYKDKHKDNLEYIGLVEDCIVFEKEGYAAILYNDYNEPVALYIKSQPIQY